MGCVAVALRRGRQYNCRPSLKPIGKRSKGTFGASPESWRRWLKNPSDVKASTQMPALGLSDDEIEALIVFIITKVQLTI
jgi:cytochrome c2